MSACISAFAVCIALLLDHAFTSAVGVPVVEERVEVREILRVENGPGRLCELGNAQALPEITERLDVVARVGDFDAETDGQRTNVKVDSLARLVQFAGEVAEIAVAGGHAGLVT
jgi:hypothetical protein